MTTRTALAALLALGLTLTGTALTAQDTVAADTETAELPAPGTFYFRGADGEFQLRCIRDASEPPRENCQLYQLLTNEAGNNVAKFTMVPLPEGAGAAAGATITTPLGTLLTKPLVMAVDSNPPKAYPFVWCDEEGCSARVGLTEEEVELMRKGAKATIQIFALANPTEPVQLTMSLIGFTKSFGVLKESSLGPQD